MSPTNYSKVFSLILLTFTQINLYSQNELIKIFSQLVFREASYATYKGTILITYKEARLMRYCAGSAIVITGFMFAYSYSNMVLW